jgi:hypothetical protein
MNTCHCILVLNGVHTISSLLRVEYVSKFVSFSFFLSFFLYSFIFVRYITVASLPLCLVFPPFCLFTSVFGVYNFTIFPRGCYFDSGVE